MPDAKITLLVVLALVAVGFAAFWVRHMRAAAQASPDAVRPTPYQFMVGFITDFLDTLGVGSFATTTTFWRARRTVPDEHIPGTLNVGHTLPTVAQAFIYTGVIKVEALTLISMIVAAVAGSLLGAPLVCRWPRRRIQRGLGLALLVLCSILVFRQFGDPKGGDALGLEGWRFWVGIGTNFVLGALMTIGVGLYAPCLVLVSLLGLNAKSIFPIMMGSCAFLMPVASTSFIRNGSYSLRAALGLTLAGIPGVLLAAYVFDELLDLYMVKWLVAVVVVYTSVTLLVASARPQPAQPPS